MSNIVPNICILNNALCFKYTLHKTVNCTLFKQFSSCAFLVSKHDDHEMGTIFKQHDVWFGSRAASYPHTSIAARVVIPKHVA